MFKEYAKQVKANAKALAETLMSKGCRVGKDVVVERSLRGMRNSPYIPRYK